MAKNPSTPPTNRRLTSIQRKALRDFPEYAEAQKTLSELRRKKEELATERSELYAALKQGKRPSAQVVRERAQALIAAGGATIPPQEQPAQSLRTFKIIDEEARVVSEAITVQEEHLRGLRRKYSAEIMKDLVDPYRAHVQAMIDATLTLAELVDEEQRFRYDLNVRENVGLTALPIPGDLLHENDLNVRDPNSTLRVWLRNCANTGFKVPSFQ